MEITQLKKTGKVKHLYHMADIHLTTKPERKVEYMEVFNNLRTYLQNSPKGLIVVAGDIFNDKTRLKPESILLFHELMTLSEIMPMILICGNHDTYYRNNNNVNSLHELVSPYQNWEIYSEPTEIQTSVGCVALLPWINPENEGQAAKFITNSTCSLLMGHLELFGFQSIRGIFIEQGYDPKHFDKFEYVLTGHYHIKSTRDNIYYLGTQYQMAFSDVWEPKGFHVFDFLARELVFVENNKKLFYTFDYNEDEPQKLDYSKFKDCYVKIFIKKRTKAASFEKYIDKFYEAGVAELAITEEVSTNPELVAVDIHKDTLQLLH